ncbi:MAG: redox-regulated ATPase YchF [Mycoplasmataceae bacterium]|nr:redox-regulated ATPase YchF [Mycoplasmataceae bacterium]
MGLSAGIVGLPNVGKSTLFNTITNSSVEAANYPFATIEPNVGVVKVPDHRLYDLANLIQPDKITPAICTFVDIAGLVKGASKGEGLGNKFLANIREVDAICHVVRCFDDKQITHVYDQVDPVRDAEVINYELILADWETIEKRFSKVVAKSKSGDKQAAVEEKICREIMTALKSNQFAKTVSMNEEEFGFVKNYNLLTMKPVLYIANVNEDDVANPESNIHFQKLKQFVSSNGNDQVVAISANIENEISKLSEADKQSFMNDLGIKEPGLDRLIKMTYKLLNLCTYFTFGKSETKAWTFKKGMTAPQCAGIIHTDFEKGFIRVEVIDWKDLIQYKTETLVKENGKLRTEGKGYIMQDGDVCHFRFNV